MTAVQDVDNASLSLHLQEGFSDDHVTVSVDGQVAIDATVTTSLLTGLGAVVTVPVRAGTVTVRTMVRGLDQPCQVQLAAGDVCNLGIALVDGAVSYVRSSRSFFYG